MNRKRSETYSYCTRLPGVGNQYRQLGLPIRITAQIFVPQIRAHDHLFYLDPFGDGAAYAREFTSLFRYG